MKNIFNKKICNIDLHVEWNELADILQKLKSDDDFNELSDSEKKIFIRKIFNQNKEKFNIKIEIKHLNCFQFIFEQTVTKIINFLTKINS
jgi:hypothetical protein